ncbi:MAG: FAD/FMN-containing dehydrogenase [Myxococcales bacterium]|nr:FAD/FMN-containing dehydrogenase [Myxococcales bacterium]
MGAGVGMIALTRAVVRKRRALRQMIYGEIYPADVCERMHAGKVARIAAQLRAHAGDKPVSLRKKAAPHQVPKGGDLRRRDDKIDISDLTAIIDIDPVARTCTAESGVTFVDLVAATLRHGLVPIVVPELKTITVGGAVSGCSIESMSFRYGGFHDTCLEYEVITASGERVTCTPDNDQSLLFQMIHGSFGTLGILAKLKFRLVPAQPFVHVGYEHHTTLSDYQASIRRHFDAQDVDFMDGIIHAPDRLVLCIGKFVAEAPYTHRYDWTRVYYQSTAERIDDYLATPDYLFRYDRGVTNVHPKSWIGRLLVGKLMGSQQVLRLADNLNFLFKSDKPTVILDVFLPFSKAPEFLAWWERELGFFPLWCVPYKRVRDYEWLDESFYSSLQDPLFLDLAIYGMEQKDERNVHRMIEEKLRELGGMKTLISHNYYSRDEFWSIWNKPNYDRVKQETDPRNLFRDLYSKTCRAAMGLPG